VKKNKLLDDWSTTSYLDERMQEQLKIADEKELDDFFYQTLPFGTGGMRGLIGPGTNRMNLVMVSRATKGFGHYLQERYENEINVVIGYDNRNYSREFAFQAARVLSSLNIKSFVFNVLTATPIVSYTIRRLRAQAGIIITASHNPPEYNGFKIFDETGCQLLPKEAEQVVDKIEAIENIFDIEVSESGIIVLDDENEERYIAELSSLLSNETGEKELTIGFSPQHGTALEPVMKIFEKYGYRNCQYVKEQSTVDGYFSGTKSANPEDQLAFELLKQYGKRYKLDLLLTTDPDADRVGAAYRNTDGSYTNLTGNQVGALLTDYYVGQKSITDQTYLVKTIVTSELGAAIARAHGVEVINVLTGFKYIGDIINKKGEANFLLGYEESYGYLVNPITRDKDGIQIVLALAELANLYLKKGMTLGDRLEQIYQSYGYYLEDLVSLNLPGRSGVQQIQETYQQYKQLNWEDIAYIEDYEELIRKNVVLGTEEQMEFDQSQVLKIVFKDGSWMCVRPSGTEPKLKIYFGVKEESRMLAETTMNRLKDRVAELYIRKLEN